MSVLVCFVKSAYKHSWICLLGVGGWRGMSAFPAHLPGWWKCLLWSRTLREGNGPHPNLHPYPLCPQILLGHPPPYAVDVTTQVPTVPTPAAVLSPPLPEVLPPTAPELLPQLPGSLAPTLMAAAQSLPVQTTALLPPANLPLPSGPGITGPCPAVQLTVELAPEVCGPPLGALPPFRHPDPSATAAFLCRGLWSQP